MNPLKFNRTVRDSVHGSIRLSEEEFNIIGHELFFRLHQIRQNGLLYFIFPSATHTRFEHSLGVLNVADQTFWSLLRNSSSAKEKNALAKDYDTAKLGEAFPFHEIDPKILTDLHKITRISALVHDLGHGPFSHTFDAFAPKTTLISNLIGRDDRLKGIRGLIPILQKSNRNRVEHEEMSCFFFTLITDELIRANKIQGGIIYKAEELAEIVSAIILGEPELCTNSAMKPYIFLLHDLVASAPVDVDRMDYLERDSRSIGVSYGLYDRDRLLKSFLVYKSISDNSDETIPQQVCRLGIKFSGLRAVENFIQARFELFVQIYYHKTNSAIMFMLSQIAELATRGKVEILTEMNSVDELIKVYTNLSDTRFLRILQGLDKEFELEGDLDSLTTITNLANKIATRKLWKRVLEGDHNTAQKVEEELKSESLGENLQLYKFEAKATKDLEKGAALLKRTGKEGIYTSDNAQESNWFDHSPMINALAKEEKTIVRIYYKGEDTELLSTLRATARIAFNNLENKK